MHEWGQRLSWLKVSEVTGSDGGGRDPAHAGQWPSHGLAMCNPPPPLGVRPYSPMSSQRVKRRQRVSVHVGIGAHPARLAELFQKVLVSLGSSAVATGKARSGTTASVRRRHKATACEWPNRGRDDGSPAEPEKRKNNDATTHPATSRCFAGWFLTLKRALIVKKPSTG